MEKTKREKVLDYFGIIWTSIFLAALILYPTGVIFINKPINPVNNIIVVPGLVYLILKRLFIKRSVVISTRIDVVMNLFFLTMFLPLILGTYVSMYECIRYILIYFTALVLYNVVKNLSYDKKNIEVLLNVLLILLFIVVLYGIDMNCFKIINSKLGLITVNERSEYTINSFHYVYHNTLAIVMASGIFISQYKLEKNSKKIRYQISLISCIIGFLIAMSRIAIVIFCILEIIKTIYDVKHKKSKKNVANLIISFIIAAIYVKIYNANSDYIVLFAYFIAVAINIIISIFLNKKDHNFKGVINVNLKTISLFCIVIISLILALLIKDDLKINTNSYSKISNSFILLKNIRFSQDNKVVVKYKFNDVMKNTGKYRLVLFGVNQNGIYDTIETIILKENTDEVSSTIFIDEKYKEVKANIIVNDINEFESIVIDEIDVNSESQTLKYKFLPYSIQYLINSIDFNNVSINERINLYKDALNTIKNSKFIGLGSNAWKCIFQSIQSLNYYSNEIHSRPLEVLLSYGIVGFICYLTLIIFVIKLFLKKCPKENNIYLFFVLVIIVTQSFIDFVATQFSVVAVTYLMLGIFNSYNDALKNRKSDYLLLIIYFLISSYIVKDYINTKKSERTIDNTPQYSFYNNFSREDYINKNIVLQNNSVLLKNELEKYLLYERHGDNYLNLKLYLEVCSSMNYAINEKLVSNVINYLMVSDAYCIEKISEYIYTLDKIKQYLKKYNMEEGIQKINYKMNLEIENLINKMKEYKYYPMYFDSSNKIDENLEKESFEIIESLKQIVYSNEE